MESVDTKALFYVKLQSVTPLDKSAYCRYLPCMLGRESHLGQKI